MPNYKVTLVMGWGEYGWTESWYLNSPTTLTPLTIFNQFASQLGAYRQALLCTGADIEYVRIATVGVPFAVQTFPFNSFANNNFGSPGVSPFVALLLRCTPAAVGPNKNVFFRGIPDNQLGSQSYLPTVAFTKALNQFINYLLTAQNNSVWGWWGVQSKTSAPVTNYVPAQTGYQQLITTGPVPTTGLPLFQGVNPGTKVRVRYSGINGKSELNGTQVVIVQTPNTALTKEAFGVVPFNKQGNCEFPTYGFSTLSAINAERITERKPGRPLFASRGRQANRAKT
jgi:hypothetical protein